MTVIPASTIDECTFTVDTEDDAVTFDLNTADGSVVAVWITPEDAVPSGP